MRRLQSIANFTMALATTCSVIGCGTQGAIDATNSVPGKLDQTNGQMSQMSGKIDTTNNNMTSMSGKIDTTNSNMNSMSGKIDTTNSNMTSMSGKIDTTNNNMASMSGKIDTTNNNMASMSGKIDTTNNNMASMSGKLDQTNENTKSLGAKMDITNAAIHDQALGVALDTMIKPENTKFLTSPTDMFPSGQVFADVASPEEILQLIHATMQGNRTQALDASQFKGGTIPDEVMASTDHDKLAKFVGLEIISGLMSQDKVDQIIKTQIDSGGLYQLEAYEMLALRFDFIKNIELDNDLMTEPLSNPGKMQQAVTLATALSAIADLKDVDKFEAKTAGMLIDANNRDLTVEPGEVKALWKKLAKAIDKDLDPRYLQPGNPSSSTLAALKAEVLSHVSASVPAPN